MRIFLIMLVISLGVYAEDIFNIANERLHEIKLDLKKELLMKRFENEVVGTLEFDSGKIFLNAYMAKTKDANQDFVIKEVRDYNTFKLIDRYSYLPTKTFSKNIVKQETKVNKILKGIMTFVATISVLFISLRLIGMHIKRTRLRKRKRALQNGENRKIA